jgi:hypothetical protein
MSRAAEEEDLEFSGTQYNYQYDIGMIPFISK